MVSYCGKDILKFINLNNPEDPQEFQMNTHILGITFLKSGNKILIWEERGLVSQINLENLA